MNFGISLVPGLRDFGQRQRHPRNIDNHIDESLSITGNGYRYPRRRALSRSSKRHKL